MQIFVNKVEYQVTKVILSDVLPEVGVQMVNGIAVAVNDKVIPKSQWHTFEVQPHDKLTIIRATQGG